MSFDNIGNLYLCGTAINDSFPILSLSGAFNQGIGMGGTDGFIAKFNNNFHRDWTTLFGGTGADEINSVHTDANNNIYVMGSTYSSNFPVKNPYGGAFYDSILNGGGDSFLAKFNSLNQRIWSTYIGGDNLDYSIGKNNITTDPFNNLYIVGNTKSTDFPCKNLGGNTLFDSTFSTNYYGDGFIMQFNSSNCNLKWSTYLSGNYGGTDLRAVKTDELGIVYIGGASCDYSFAFKQYPDYYFQDTLNTPLPFAGSPTNQSALFCFNRNGEHLWSSLFGGYDYHFTGQAFNDIEINGTSALYFTGFNSSQNIDSTKAFFPIRDPGNNAFVNSVFSGPVSDAFIVKFCIDPSLSVNQINNNNNLSFSIYPNPTSNYININFYKPINTSASLSIISIIGQTVLQKKIGTQTGEITESINVSQLSRGIYFVRLNIDEKISVAKLVVQ
jgi:hypothetical protein